MIHNGEGGDWIERFEAAERAQVQGQSENAGSGRADRVERRAEEEEAEPEPMQDLWDEGQGPWELIQSQREQRGWEEEAEVGGFERAREETGALEEDFELVEAEEFPSVTAEVGGHSSSSKRPNSSRLSLL